MLDIKSVNKGNTQIIELEGNFDVLGVSSFEKEISAINKQVKFWILDFGKVSFLSSTGIRILVLNEKKLRQLEGNIILCNLTRIVASTLGFAGLLKQFQIAENITQAYALIQSIESRKLKKQNFNIEDKEYFFQELSGNKSRFDIWDAEQNNNNFIFTGLNEMGYSLGTGCSAATREEAIALKGNFVSFPCFFGYELNKKAGSDFIISAKPETTGVYISSGISFRGNPQFYFRLENKSPIRVDQLVEDIFSLLSRQLDKVLPAAGILISGSIVPEKTEKNQKPVPFAGLLIAVHKAALSEDIGFELLCKFFPVNENNNGEFDMQGVGVFTEKPLSINEASPLDSLTTLMQMDNIISVGEIFSQTNIINPHAWIFIPDSINPAEDSRLKIEKNPGIKWTDEAEIIVRQVYSNVGKIILEQLHGGFSATTFFVDSYDNDGRRLFPSVFKMASHPMITRESERCENYARKYIHNNCPDISSTFFYREMGGMSYNFVGITGSGSNIRWLTHIYKERTAEELYPLFDKIFTDILKPWYGQPKLEYIYPYKSHNPMNTFFPHLLDTAASELGMNVDEQTFFGAEYNREMINPYWFLKYIFQERVNEKMLWYTSICHGDLNMQNILLDEAENIYIIDFSETKPRNIVSDFARLEPIFLIECTDIETENDLKLMLELLESLINVKTLKQKPEFTYRNNSPKTEKAFKMICKVREYADIVTLFETDIVPYFLAMLEWTLPIVCYGGQNIYRKKLSMYSASLMCESIMAHYSDKAN